MPISWRPTLHPPCRTLVRGVLYFEQMALVFTIAASVAFLAIAITAVLRRGHTPLAIHVSLMSVALFAYTSLDAVAVLTGDERWDCPSYAFAALLAIPTFDLAVGFVGMRRRLRWARRALAGYFVILALATLAPLFVSAWQGFPGGHSWSVAMLIGVAPAVVASGVLLRRHARRGPPEERARTRLLVWSLLLGVGGSVTDLVLISLNSSVRLSAFPLAMSSILVAALILRARLLEGVTAMTLLNGGVIAVLAIVGQLAVYAYSGTQVALLAFGTFVVVLTVLAASRPLLSAMSEQRARVQYLATLGRFSEQMAHDIRNPLAAIQGAAQFLQEEHRQGRSLDPHVEFLDLIVERVERLDRVIREYQRIGRVELRRESLDINKLVQGVLDGDVAAESGEVRVQAELARDLPEFEADRDLVTVALENVVRNAYEAMPDGGVLEVSTQRVGDRVVVSVGDSGGGMDARSRDRAFDEFFTTKPTGSGLGLPFVARIAEAHGGTVELDSEEGRGTKVAIELPCTP